MAILMYHHIGACPVSSTEHRGLWVAPTLFEAHLEWFRQHGYRALTVSEVADALVHNPKELRAKWIALTFDDGWYDNYTEAFPLLKRFGFRATFYVTTGQIRSGDPTGSPEDMMSAAELRELAQEGNEIGAHTRMHPRLTRLDNEQAVGEIAGSREDLANILGGAPRTFAYPYGNVSKRIANLVRASGFEAAVSTIRDNRVSVKQLYWLPRVMIMGDTPASKLSYLLSWSYHILHLCKNVGRWKGIK